MILREQSGFSVIELLVAASLSIVVFGAALIPLNAFQRAGNQNTKQNQAQAKARQTMDRMARELRNIASQSQDVETATGTDLVFQTVDALSNPSGSNSANVKRVRYCLNSSSSTNGVIWKQVQTWTTASPPAVPSTSSCPDAAWPSQQQVVTNVTNANRAVWTYDTSTAANVTTIKTTLYIDVAPSERPGESQLTSGIFLRNQNKAPIATFTATATGNRHVTLNGSGSYDPEGATVTYKWLDGSTQIGTGQTCDCIALATGSRTITLQATDQSGAVGQASQTVNVL
jgi:Tfp pilus assembly protein PilV